MALESVRKHPLVSALIAVVVAGLPWLAQVWPLFSSKPPSEQLLYGWTTVSAYLTYRLFASLVSLAALAMLAWIAYQQRRRSTEVAIPGGAVGTHPHLAGFASKSPPPISITVDPDPETRLSTYPAVGMQTTRLSRVFLHNASAEVITAARILVESCHPSSVTGVHRDEPLSAVGSHDESGRVDINPFSRQRFNLISEEHTANFGNIRPIAYARGALVPDLVAVAAGYRAHKNIPKGTVLTLRAEGANTSPVTAHVRIDEDARGEAAPALVSSTSEQWLNTATLGFKQSKDKGGLTDVYMEFSHQGPTSAFKIQAVYVTGAVRTPWSVRWVGSSEETKQVVRGHPELLHLCRVDPSNVASALGGKRWEPGRFVFLAAATEIEVLMPTAGMLRSSDIHKGEIVVTLHIIAVPSGDFTARKIGLGINEDLSIRIVDKPIQSGD